MSLTGPNCRFLPLRETLLCSVHLPGIDEYRFSRHIPASVESVLYLLVCWEVQIYVFPRSHCLRTIPVLVSFYRTIIFLDLKLCSQNNSKQIVLHASSYYLSLTDLFSGFDQAILYFVINDNTYFHCRTVVVTLHKRN
jgi:hypothetical protein